MPNYSKHKVPSAPPVGRGGAARYDSATLPTEKEERRVDLDAAAYGYASDDSSSEAGSTGSEGEDDLTSEEMKEIVLEVVKRLGSEGLDSPENHVEYVLRQLESALAT